MNAKILQRLFWALVVIAIAAALFLMRTGKGQPNQVSKTVPPPITPAGHAAATASPRSSDQAGEVEVDLPFVGSVPAVTSSESVSIATRGGAANFPFTIYRRRDGIFLRAEFFKAGSPRYEATAAELERGMAVREERVIGLPKTGPPIPWQRVVNEFDHGDMGRAVGISVTYVDYHMGGSPELNIPDIINGPCFLVHVFGVDTISDKLPDEERFRRIRGVFKASGELIRFDNCL